MTLCDLDECERPAVSLGLCQGHYQRYLRHGPTFDPSPIRRAVSPVVATCGADGCTGDSYAKGLCSKHYSRQRTTGRLDLDPVVNVQPIGWCKCPNSDPQPIRGFLGFVTLTDVFQCGRCWRGIRPPGDRSAA